MPYDLFSRISHELFCDNNECSPLGGFGYFASGNSQKACYGTRVDGEPIPPGSADSYSGKISDYREIIRKIKKLVPEYIDLFRDAGEYLDQEYGNSRMRKQLADDIREVRSNPNYNRLSRSYRRKHGESELVESPPRRDRDENGRLLHPIIPLNYRYTYALYREISCKPALCILRKEERIRHAKVQLLLIWIYLDVDHHDVAHVTEFQNLIAKSVGRAHPVPDFDADEEQDDRLGDRVVFRNHDGSYHPFIQEWLANRAEDALEILDQHISEHTPSAGEDHASVNGKPGMSCQEARGKANEPAPIVGRNLEDDTDEPQAPSLTPSDQVTLRALATFDASRLVSSTQVIEAMPAVDRLSDRTTRSAIRKLIECGLAERPEGQKQGTRLTLKGRRLAGRLAD